MKIDQKANDAGHYKEMVYSIDEKFGFELENAKEESKKGDHAK